MLRVGVPGRGTRPALDRGQHYAGHGLLLAAREGQPTMDAALQLLGLLFIADRLLRVRIVDDDQPGPASLFLMPRTSASNPRVAMIARADGEPGTSGK